MKFEFKVTLPENTQGRDFVLGDLHGCMKLLKKEMQKVKFDIRKDRIIAVGDLIDRGEHSLDCLRLPRYPWFFSVRGNHEQMMIDALEGYDWQMWVANGGEWVYDPGVNDVLMQDIDEWKSMPFQIDFIRQGFKFGVVHADPPKIWDDEVNHLMHKENMLWGRDRLKKPSWYEPVKDVDHVFAGHTPVKSVFALNGVTYIDTGGVFNSELALVDLDEYIDILFKRGEL